MITYHSFLSASWPTTCQIAQKSIPKLQTRKSPDSQNRHHHRRCHHCHRRCRGHGCGHCHRHLLLLLLLLRMYTNHLATKQLLFKIAELEIQLCVKGGGTWVALHSASWVLFNGWRGNALPLPKMKPGVWYGWSIVITSIFTLVGYKHASLLRLLVK